jgi:TonB family protein
MLLSSCSSRPPIKPEFMGWYTEVKAKADAAWRPMAAEELSREKKADQLQTVFDRYTVQIALAVDASGKIIEHKILEPSPVPVMNRIAESTLAKIDPLPAPPPALLKKGRTEIRWEFKIDR